MGYVIFHFFKEFFYILFQHFIPLTPRTLLLNRSQVNETVKWYIETLLLDGNKQGTNFLCLILCMLAKHKNLS